MKIKLAQVDDIKISRGFLFLPKTIKGEVRWFEHASWKSILRSGKNEFGNHTTYWEDVEWIERI